METVKKYINFAIDNGYKFPFGEAMSEMKLKDAISFKCCVGVPYSDILSKEFIEAIVRGLNTNGVISIDIGTIGDIWNLKTKITFQQAIAIRDGKLEEFINNLLK